VDSRSGIDGRARCDIRKEDEFGTGKSSRVVKEKEEDEAEDEAEAEAEAEVKLIDEMGRRIEVANTIRKYMSQVKQMH